MPTRTEFDPLAQPLRQILDQSGAVVFLKDRDGRYLLVNGGFEDVAGLRMEEIIGKSDEELFPAELALRLRHNDLRVLHELKTLQFEETGDFAGRERTFLTSKFPLLNPDGSAYAVCGMATDITERKHLEAALRRAALAVSATEGDAVFRELVQALASLLRADGAFIAVPNAADPSRLTMVALLIDGTLRESFDYPLAGTPCETIVGQQFRHYPSRLRELFPLDADFRALGIDSYAGFPLSDAAGDHLGLIAVISRHPFGNPELVESILKIFAVRAVSELERQRSYRALQASAANYRAIFDATEDAVFVHDFETGAIIDANPQACRAYGYSREELRRLRPGDLSSGVPPYTEEEASRLISEARSGHDVRFEWHRRNRDGTLRWDDVTLKSIEIGGRPVILAFTRDITHRKQAEQQRAQLEAQLRQAQKMEAIGQLAGGIAHDFNNLLTSILGYVVMTRDRLEGGGDATAVNYLDQAQLSCERARDLIQQMLTFSRGSRGEPRAVELQPLVDQTLKLLRSSLPATVDLRSSFAAPLPTVLADPVHIEQVVFNLCLNARDALEGPGTIAVGVGTAEVHGVCASCRRSFGGRFACLEVMDDGSGIPTDVIDRIFEPFFTTKETGKGSGMGLAMVHGIVHEQGGHVLVDSPAGTGTRFRAFLPLLAPAIGDTAALADAIPQRSNARLLPRLTGHVLLVDDEASVGRYMTDLLTGWGLSVTYCESAAAAMESLRKKDHAFDVLITDQTMPGTSGLELAARVRQHEPPLPVLLFSGYSSAIDESRLAASGVQGFFRKPVDTHSLHELLSGVLAESGRASPSRGSRA